MSSSAPAVISILGNIATRARIELYAYYSLILAVGQGNATVSARELPSERLHGGQRVARLADKKQIQPAH